MVAVNARATALLLVAATVALSSCSKSAQNANTAADAVGKPSAAMPAHPKSNLVAAVSVGKPGAAVDLHFDLAARPKVGEALQIGLELTPRSAASQLHVSVVGNDGISVAGSGELDGADRPAVDVALKRSVSVTPQREGMFYLSVFVETDDGLTRSFAIPLIVGDLGAAAAAQKPSTTVDATAQRVESLPAQESSRSR